MTTDLSAPTRFVLLELVPHADTVRARRIANPDLSRLREPRWWSNAIWGQPGGRDPMPICVRVVELDPATAADIFEDEDEDENNPTPPSTPGQLELPFDEDDTSLTEAQAKLVDILFESDTACVMRNGSRYELLVDSVRGASTKLNKKTVDSLVNKGLLEDPSELGDGVAVYLTESGEAVGARRNP